MSDLYGIPRPDLEKIAARAEKMLADKSLWRQIVEHGTCDGCAEEQPLRWEYAETEAWICEECFADEKAHHDLATDSLTLLARCSQLEAEVERLRRLRDACGSGLADLHSMRKALPYEAQLIVDALRLDLSLPAEAVALIEADRRGEVEYELLPDDTTGAGHVV